MTTPKLIIGNYNYSSWSLRAWLALRKSGVDFITERIPLDSAEFEQRISALSPSRRVPALWHAGLCVWDSLAIGEYVNEVFADGGLWPADRSARALGRSMAAEMHSGFEHLRGRMPMNIRATGRTVPLTEPLRLDIERIWAIWAQARALRPAEGPWLLGRYSLADAMFAPVVLRLRTYGVTSPPELAAYCRQVLEDPDLRPWQDAALAEDEVIAADEAGG
ncbi:MAG: glutathione S-transferase family protein [Anaerolineae bacterium]